MNPKRIATVFIGAMNEVRVKWPEGFMSGAFKTGVITGPPDDGWIPIRRDDNGLLTWLWWQNLTVL